MVMYIVLGPCNCLSYTDCNCILTFESFNTALFLVSEVSVMWRTYFYENRVPDGDHVPGCGSGVGPIHRVADSFLQACKSGDVSRAETMVTVGRDVLLGDDQPYWAPAVLFACQSGNEALLDIVSTRLGVNGANIHGETPLHVACLHGNHAMVVKLTREGADVTSETKEGRTCLHYACRSQSLEVVQELFKHSSTAPTVDKCDTEGATALHLAARGGCVNIVRILLTKLANPYLSTLSGETAVMSALEAGEKASDVIAELEGEYPDIEYMINEPRETVSGLNSLHMACRNISPSQVDYLLEKGGDVTGRARDGSTPLHCVCWGSYSAEPSGRRRRGEVNLYDGTYEERSHIIDALLQRRVERPRLDLASIDMFGMTAAHYICRHGSMQDVDVMKTLLKAGFPVDTATGASSILLKVHPSVALHEGVTCLHLACANGSVSLVRLLLCNHANPNAATAEGWTPLHTAVRCHPSCDRARRVLTLLLSHGADASIADSKGKTALHHVCVTDLCKGSHDNMVSQLVKASPACVNSQDHRGQTPLMYAIKHSLGDVSIARMLACKHLDPNVSDHSGTHAFSMLLTECCRSRELTRRFLQLNTKIPELVPSHCGGTVKLGELMMMVTAGQARLVPDAIALAMDLPGDEPGEIQDILHTCVDAQPIYTYNKRDFMATVVKEKDAMVTEDSDSSADEFVTQKFDVAFPSLYAIARTAVRQHVFAADGSSIVSKIPNLQIPTLLQPHLLLGRSFSAADN